MGARERAFACTLAVAKARICYCDASVPICVMITYALSVTLRMDVAPSLLLFLSLFTLSLKPRGNASALPRLLSDRTANTEKLSMLMQRSGVRSPYPWSYLAISSLKCFERRACEEAVAKRYRRNYLFGRKTELSCDVSGNI